jgi:ribosomal protein L37AE/L43A
MMNEELKACPYCGNEAVLREDGKCAICNGTDKYCPGAMYFPVEKWNNRPIEDQLRKQVERAEEVILSARQSLQSIYSVAVEGKLENERHGHIVDIARCALKEINQVELPEDRASLDADLLDEIKEMRELLKLALARGIHQYENEHWESYRDFIRAVEKAISVVRSDSPQ